MDSVSDSINKSTDGFVAKVMNVDTLTKNKVMNSIQFIIFAAIPVALIDMLTKHLFSNNNPESKGSAELFAEIVIQLSTTILLVIIVTKIIFAMPTYTEQEMIPINYINVSLGYLISSFATNHCNITDKYLIIMARLNESWSGKTHTPQTNKQKNSNVSISKPISGMPRQIPTHQNSRADVRSPMDQAMAPPIVPNGSPAPPPSFHDEQPNQNMYGSENSIGGEGGFPSQDPIAANGVLGGGGFSSW